jgi:hypothetical protein
VKFTAAHFTLRGHGARRCYHQLLATTGFGVFALNHGRVSIRTSGVRSAVGTLS